MNKLPSKAYRLGLAFTMVSTIAALLPVVVPPTVLPSSVGVLDALTKDVQAIVGITRVSKNREIMEFGEYVNRVVQILVSALQNDKLTQLPGIMESLEKLRQTLFDILSQLSRLNGPVVSMSRIRHMLLPQEDHVRRMRQRLSDALDEFQLSAHIQLLGGTANLPTSKISDAPALTPSHAQMFDRRSCPPHGCSCTTGHQTIQTADRTQDSSILPPSSDIRRAQRHGQKSGYYHMEIDRTAATAPGDGEIPAAFMRVGRLRRSLYYNHSSDKEKELASALGHLSDLLDKVGRTHEALKTSQEAAELYRTLAEREHTNLYTL